MAPGGRHELSPLGAQAPGDSPQAGLYSKGRLLGSHHGLSVFGEKRPLAFLPRLHAVSLGRGPPLRFAQKLPGPSANRRHEKARGLPGLA